MSANCSMLQSLVLRTIECCASWSARAPSVQVVAVRTLCRRPSTSCTGVYLAITMLQYYICVGLVLTVDSVLGLGLGFGIILYIVIGT